MEGDLLSREAYQIVVQDAHFLWHEFVGAFGREKTCAQIFSQDIPTTRFAREFLRFSSLRRVPGYVSGANITLSNLHGSNQSPSWLWRYGSSVPLIIVDFNYVSSQIISRSERRKVLFRLMLHEIGHVVLHWNSLNERDPSTEPIDPNDPIKARNASAEQEEAAWLFCGCVMGLALGLYAKMGRPDVIDQAWSHA